MIARSGVGYMIVVIINIKKTIKLSSNIDLLSINKVQLYMSISLIYVTSVLNHLLFLSPLLIN